ncbi:hypothetical protein BJF78_15155 [Pseudonocardia sp. CNS-139]|nr:hypothetical protein BJF78_15155 [Pseudonocardia sp. CNS-139]
MRPGPGEVLHFSEDPTITVFVPHVAATAKVGTPYVWAVDAGRAPDYWFPRQCPRALAWATPASRPADVERLIGPGGGRRVHAVEFGWLERMRTVELYAYRLPAAAFTPFPGPAPHAHVSTEVVRPLGPPERVGDLFALHAEAGIQLRVLPELHGFWTAVTASSLGFSGIRLRGAVTRRSSPA